MPALRPRSVAVSGNGLRANSFAQVAVGLRQLADRGEQEADREVRDLVGQDVGRVGDHDAALPGLGSVHVS